MSNPYRTTPHSNEGSALWPILALGASVVSLAFLTQRFRAERTSRAIDDAPLLSAHRQDSGRYALTGRTVTIAKPRQDLYRFWREFSNLETFMENVRSVEVDGDLTRWVIAAPAGKEVSVETRITDECTNDFIAWRSTPASDIETEGRVTFRDASGNRGTELEAHIAYVPPGGEIGLWIAKAFQAEPTMQGRRDLKRLKMLMETGEIATNRNRRTPA